MKINNRLQTDAGLLIFRGLVGLMMLLIHGLQKLLSWDRLFHSFADPISLGSEISFILAVIAEVACSFLLIIGLFARYAVIPLFITMIVAIFIVHGNDPWTQKELPMIYAISFLTLFLTGPGKYSLDHIRKRR